MLKALDTQYKGFLFRSRLEARWGIALDGFGLSWDYKPEGFDLGGVWYLPDFRIKTQDGFIWLEVKPDAEISYADARKCIGFQVAAGIDSFFVIRGNPWPGEYTLLGDCLTPTAFVFSHCPLCDTIDIRTIQGWEYLDCKRCKALNPSPSEFSRLVGGLVHSFDPIFFTRSAKLMQAYRAAHQARFGGAR